MIYGYAFVLVTDDSLYSQDYFRIIYLTYVWMTHKIFFVHIVQFSATVYSKLASVDPDPKYSDFAVSQFN